MLPALAHHSLAAFDDSKKIVITGTVQEFQWTNPHTLTLIDVGDAGIWRIEGQAPQFLSWRGWTRDTMKPGDKVSMTIYRLKHGQKGGTCLRVKLPGGREMFMLENPPQPAP